MSAKPLKVQESLEAQPRGDRPDGGRAWMVKRHGRSVHREARRPQGSCSPQKQFSPVKSVDADDDGVNVSGSQHPTGRHGETGGSPSGFEAVACVQRSVIELGRALDLPGSGEGLANQKEAA